MNDAMVKKLANGLVLHFLTSWTSWIILNFVFFFFFARVRNLIMKNILNNNCHVGKYVSSFLLFSSQSSNQKVLNGASVVQILFNYLYIQFPEIKIKMYNKLEHAKPAVQCSPDGEECHLR